MKEEKIEKILRINRAYQEAFSFGGISPTPSFEVLKEFGKLIDVTNPQKTGERAWLWKRTNNQLWKDHMILWTSYEDFGKRIIDAFNS